MRPWLAVLLATALGLSLGACSKCDMPVWMPKSCQSGTAPTPH